jgi:hypothetical protein
MWKKQKNGDKLSPELIERRRVLWEWKELRRDSQNIRIEVCAVWDTVSAIGFPMAAHIPQLPRKRYLTVGKHVPRNVKFAVQALALDERRRHFKPMAWKKSPKVIQRWFAGNHSDVGGGNKDPTLANICLAWMIGQLTDNIEFNHNNLWAITTTRLWSKPSPGDLPDDRIVEDLDHEFGGKPEKRCKVEATAPISLELCMYSLHRCACRFSNECSTIERFVVFILPTEARRFSVAHPANGRASL